MPNRNLIISIIVIIICILSLSFLLKLLYHDQAYLMVSSIPRLRLFGLIHIFIIAMMAWFVWIRNIIDYVLWGFVFTSVLCIVFTVLQIYIRIHRLFNTHYNIRTVYPMQLAYLNCYFLAYMYCSICAFLTGLYLIMTKCCTWIQQIKIKKAIKESITPITRSQMTKQLQCPICLLPLDSEQQQQEYLLQIKCKHIFHQQCLVQWIRVNQSCPTCRYHIFQALEQQEVDIEVIRI